MLYTVGGHFCEYFHKREIFTKELMGKEKAKCMSKDVHKPVRHDRSIKACSSSYL